MYIATIGRKEAVLQPGQEVVAAEVTSAATGVEAILLTLEPG